MITATKPKTKASAIDEVRRLHERERALDAEMLDHCEEDRHAGSSRTCSHP